MLIGSEIRILREFLLPVFVSNYSGAMTNSCESRGAALTLLAVRTGRAHMNEQENLKPRESGAAPAWGKIRLWEVALAAALVAVIAIAVYVSRRGMHLTMPTSVLEEVEEIPPAPIDETLATFNALAYHLYAVKNDVGQYDRVRSNLANLALTDEELAQGIEEAHGALLDLCMECERFFIERKELDEARRIGRRENIVRTASATGGVAVGTAARYAVTGVSPLGLALAGGLAASHVGGHIAANKKVELAYQTAIEKAKVALHDQIARSEHELVNLRARMEKERGWSAGQILTEQRYLDYTKALAKFAEEENAGALPELKRIAALAGMAEAYFYAGLIYLSHGNGEMASVCLTEAIRGQPQNFVYSRDIAAAAHYHLAQISLVDERWTDAIGQVNSALVMGGEQPDFHCLRGEILLEAKYIEEADEAFERALELAPGFGRAMLGLAQTKALLGEGENALDLLEKAAREGQVNLSQVSRDPQLQSLQTNPRFQALTHLEIGLAIDWGPISDKILVTNNNTFPLTNILIAAKRKNKSEESIRLEAAQTDLLEPNAAFKVSGEIGRGGMVDTDYFEIELTCDQGEWKDKLVIENEE
jgi:tetratricopeptide (TPR) repeat protein